MMKSTKKCPLFSTISLAADGDEVAIEKILICGEPTDWNAMTHEKEG